MIKKNYYITCTRLIVQELNHFPRSIQHSLCFSTYEEVIKKGRRTSGVKRYEFLSWTTLAKIWKKVMINTWQRYCSTRKVLWLAAIFRTNKNPHGFLFNFHYNCMKKNIHSVTVFHDYRWITLEVRINSSMSETWVDDTKQFDWIRWKLKHSPTKILRHQYLFVLRRCIDRQH